MFVAFVTAVTAFAALSFDELAVTAVDCRLQESLYGPDCKTAIDVDEDGSEVVAEGTLHGWGFDVAVLVDEDDLAFSGAVVSAPIIADFDTVAVFIKDDDFVVLFVKS